MAYLRQSKNGPFLFGPLAPRRVAAEMLPVPPEMVVQIWPNVKGFFGRVPEFDVEQQKARLLTGADRLWVAVQTAGYRVAQRYLGIIVTAVTEKPPSKRPVFRRTDPAARRSLTVHLVDGSRLLAWLDSAVERITVYGLNQHCRQLFLRCRKSWRRYAMRFYSAEHWDTVAYSRDRASHEARYKQTRNRPGYYRLVVRVKECPKQLYNTGSYCYFKEVPTQRLDS